VKLELSVLSFLFSRFLEEKNWIFDSVKKKTSIQKVTPIDINKIAICAKQGEKPKNIMIE
jgi:hypothetical protein